MELFKRITILIIAFSLSASCSSENVLSDFSNKESDEALYIDAKKALDEMEWDTTIDIINNQLSSTYQDKRDVKLVLASAYAGQCGLLFANLIQGMTNNPSSQMFRFFMGVWAGRTVAPDSCELAIDVLQGIGSVSERSDKENLFLALLGVARMGTNLSANLDSGDHDGDIDADATVCHDDASGSLTKWPDGPDDPGNPDVLPFPYIDMYRDEFGHPPGGMTKYLSANAMKRVASGFGLVLENFAALSDALGSGTSIDSIGDLSADCDAALAAIPGAGAGCATMTTPAAVSDEMVYAMRFMMDSAEFGWGTCSIADSVTFFSSLATYNPFTQSPPGTLCCPSTRIPGAPF
ncbi:hypothetical protein [Bdellovibrio sp. HCB288]|uniref:hypothetical protein n=1 Tax=Bdellovibrio sp. HCB288 TaxID=3394355 RepID=UPI0039B662E7